MQTPGRPQVSRPPVTDAYAEEEERARSLADIPLVIAELVPLLERIAVALERIAERHEPSAGETG